MSVILIIDDHAAITAAVGSLVRSLGHEAVAACGGAAGLAVLRARRVDLVITDVEMPGVSGLDLLRSLAEQGDGPPVVVFSGIDGAHDEAVRLGAVACVLKTDPMGLVPLIHQHVPPPLASAV